MRVGEDGIRASQGGEMGLKGDELSSHGVR